MCVYANGAQNDDNEQCTTHKNTCVEYVVVGLLESSIVIAIAKHVQHMVRAGAVCEWSRMRKSYNLAMDCDFPVAHFVCADT